ncbi:MAG: hypothetical protein WA823_18110 [Candidatus Acidiferrales bacterium]
MSSPHWSLVEAAALLLEPREREVVLGDLAETGERASRAVLAVFGLIVRRQVAAWREWRPWLAAFGLAMPGSFFLMGASVAVSWGVAAVVSGAALTPQTGLALLCQIVLLAAWSWTGGFVVGSISRRTVWVSAVLCASPCLMCLAMFRSQTLSRPCLVMFLVPAIVGVIMGVRMTRIPFRLAVALAVIVTSFMLPTLLTDSTSVLGWALIWPAWYLVIAARKQKRAGAECAGTD